MRRAIAVWLAVLCMPALANPPPAAILAAPSVPAREEAATLLHVKAAGRFALVAHSDSGAALQLVDMLSGPSEMSGEAGAQDGRIDTLLEAGTYKLRVFSAKNATGTVTLSALPFHDAAPPAPMPAPGTLFSADLADLQQRSFWITVPPPGTLRIAATGRALADLVLFRDGRDLVPLTPINRLVEPAKGHPLTELVADGKIEPGTYLVTAYGGKPATWADGDTANPFYIRAGFSSALAAGWAGGTIGPSGSEVFTFPAWAGAVRLDLPQPAYAELISAVQSVAIDSKSREPSATLFRANPVEAPSIELRGTAGQPYTLRCLEAQAHLPATPGMYWVSASTVGAGGDEVPPTLLLVRHDPQERPRILAGTVPNVGPGVAWHTRFNLRGPTDLLVQPTQGGPLALRTEGVKLSERLDPNTYVDVPGDLLHVHLVPAAGAFGVLDLTVGPPGLQAAPADNLPPDPVIPLGIQPLWPNQGISLVTQVAPGAETWLSARPIPVALGEAPLIVTQAKGQSLTVPVTLPPRAALASSIIGSSLPLDVSVAKTVYGAQNVTIPAPATPRTVILSATPSAPPPAPPVIPPAPPAQLPNLAAGQTEFLNLAESETRSFALHAPQGGLYQIETLGRLHTSGDIGTHFIASLATADANGAGRNMRLTPWLREGDYIVRVTAQSGTGHLGLQAAPAPLVQTATLTPGGSIRDTLAPGTGRLIPIAISDGATYKLTVLGQGEGFSGRIEDNEGWPLVAPGPLGEQTIKLRPGLHRLIVTPGATAQRMVAALERIIPETPITGHGPHALTLGKELAATWHEPKPGDPNRTPDSFTFSLAGDAHADVFLSDGMQGVLTGPGAPIRISDHFHGILPAGDWRLDVTAQGRNDLLDYTARVATDEVQPGIPRDVPLGSVTPFTIAASRVVTLSTTGRVATKAVLRAANGDVVARAGARDNDWNTALSQRLPAGAYTIEILPGLPPNLQIVAQPHFPPPDGGEGGGDSQPPDDSQTTDNSATTTTVHLDLPQDLPPVPASASIARLGGAGVHVLSLAPPPAGALIVAEKESSADGIVSLERQDAGGAWRMVAQGSGATAMAAAVSDGQNRPWRATIWALDPSAAPVTASVRALTDAPAGALTVQGGLAVAVARLDLPNPAVLDVSGPPGLMQAGFPGYAATPLTDGHALPQGNRIWFLGWAAGRITAKPTGDSRLKLDIPEGAAAYLPSSPSPHGIVRVWRADSGDGQPAFSDGTDTGALAPLSATLLDGAAPVLQNAAGAPVMRAQLQRYDLALLPAQSLGTGLAIRLPAGHAIPVDTGGARGDLQLSLSPGLAAFIPRKGGVWAPVTAVTRTVAGAPRIMLANLTDTIAAAGILPVPHAGAVLLSPGTVEKRFFGASGSFELAAESAKGAELHVAGDASLLVRDASGNVFGGRSATPAPGPAQVIATHGRGLVVLWMEAPGHPAWPSPAPMDAALPSTTRLSGPAMALRLPGAGKLLLHATTTSPVLLGFAGEPPELFPAGAEFHRAIDAASVLRIMSPQDGPLSGTLALSAEPLRPLHEGLGEQVAVPPGGSAAFAFTLGKTATVGIGVRAEPDRARVRVLNAAGRVIGEGVAQLLPNLAPGTYILEARVPPEAPTTLVRPALFGTAPRASGPPPEIVRAYLEEAGFKP